MTDALPFGDRRNRRRPETLRLRAVIPVLTVADVKASLAWYRDVMGFVVAETRDDEDGKLVGAALVAGSERLVLEQGEGKPRDGAPSTVHFQLLTVQDVDLLAEGIRARGGVLSSAPARGPDGVKRFSVTDPDGHELTLTAYA